MSRWLAPFGFVGLIDLALVGAWRWYHHGTVSTRVIHDVWSQWTQSVVIPWYGAGLLVIMALQWCFPARAEDRGFTRGLAQDGLWFLLSPILVVTLVAAVQDLVGDGMDAMLRGWHLDLVPSLGVLGAALFAFVLGDFAAWWSHVLHHRIPMLWQFHAVHHSQRRLNALTDNREHFFETMLNAVIAFVPAHLLGLDNADAFAITIAGTVLQAFVHANIRTNLGPLRYVLISPQAHRIHHSNQPRHYDTNFGSVLSIWDIAFRTRFPGNDEYPMTGIADPSFPLEADAHPLGFARTWLAQTLYPFRTLATGTTNATTLPFQEWAGLLGAADRAPTQRLRSA